MDIEKDFTLVLTASVKPNACHGVAIADPKLREAQYAESLEYILCKHPRVRRIVFVENSAWPLDRLHEGARNNPFGKQVEFISLSLNDFPGELGKSYGELRMLDQALAQSQLVRGGRYFAKMTGRNQLHNMTRLLERLADPFDLACDLRDHAIYERLGLSWTGRKGESRFFVMTLAYYDQFFRGQYQQMNEAAGGSMEELIYRIAKAPNEGQRVLRRFPIEPAFRGFAGNLLKDYSGPRERLKCGFRSVLRRVVPWLHV